MTFTAIVSYLFGKELGDAVTGAGSSVSLNETN